jgi:type I restriction enzyme R subunit
MAVDHKEVAFEDAIEAHLLTPEGGWIAGAPSDYDRELGLDREQLFVFVTSSQPKEWAKLVKLLGGNEPSARDRFAKRIAAQIDSRGTIDVLRRGVKELGVEIKLAYFKPAHGLTDELLQRYGQNRLSVTRQLMYSSKTTDELDLGLFLNGIPVATAELKNQLTNQDVEDAKKQYRVDRDPKELLFAKRAMVHFAVDQDLVFLTTKLAGKKTEFLPFNRGSETGGAGNPDNPRGYKTAYLFEEVWQHDAWLDLLGRFIHLETRELVENGRKRTEQRFIFPRYHQRDAVLKLESDSRLKGAGESYLVEHSAGSGKSNTIAWLAHRLSTLHDASDDRVFHQVVIITDRVVLDRQLQETVSQFEAKKGVVQKIDQGSKQLGDALVAGTAPILVSTLQKFPFAQALDVVIEKAAELKGRRFAVIVDEAHSSQTGEAAAALKSVLGAGAQREGSDEDDEGSEEEHDSEDALAEALAARGPQPNLSFFAFTATPKAKTLELFGTKGSGGKFRPFHLYSMKQAIEEGFILDVLANYTTYTTFWKVAKKAGEDPEVVKSEAAAAIARLVSLDAKNVAQKVEIIVEHFKNVTAAKISGKAKAMVVTQSRVAAVRYKHAIDKYLADNGYPFKALVAFSGTVTDIGIPYTEPQMNGFSESELPRKFESDEFRILVVAEKYQTGYDQPLLHTMYVGKKLEGVKAVQTLSRLNRIYPGKDDTFVLDFRNSADQIEESFQPFYEVTIAEPTDPNLLFDAADKVREHEVIREEEIEEFAKIFFKSKGEQSKEDHGLLYAKLGPAKKRFEALDEDGQEDFRDLLKRFVRLYAFLSQIVPYLEAGTERLYVYSRFLLNYLPREEPGGLDLGEDEIVLTHLRQVKTGEHAIGLTGTDEALEAFGGDGTGPTHEPETGRLSEVVELLNERFGMSLTDADQLYFDQIEETLVKSPELQKQAQANEIDNFRFGFEQKFDAAVIDRQDANEELFKKIMDDPEFGSLVKEFLLTKVYGRLAGGEGAPTPA